MKAHIANQQIHQNADNEQIINLLSSIDNRLSIIEQQLIPKKYSIQDKEYYSWKNIIYKKLNILLDYVNDHSDTILHLSDIIHSVIQEMEHRYDIDLNYFALTYKEELHLSFDTKPSVIDVIGYYNHLRDKFLFTLDSIIEKLHIDDDSFCDGNKKTKNIFDELTAKAEKDLEK